MEETHPQRIILVNDNPRALKLLELRLSEQGYQTFTAESVKDAVVTAIVVRPHLVISELHLRDLGGLDLRRILGSIAAMSRVPLIIFSSEKDLPPEFRNESGPPVQHLQKPYTFEELQRRIRMAYGEAAPGGSIREPAERQALRSETAVPKGKADAGSTKHPAGIEFDDPERTISAEPERPTDSMASGEMTSSTSTDAARHQEEMAFLKDLVARGLLRMKET